MILTNNTPWHTEDLRSFLRAGLRACRANPKKVASCQVNMARTHTLNHVDGYVWIPRGNVHLILPLTWRGHRRSDRIDLAQVFLHEVEHCHGWDHRDMPYIEDIWCAWTRGLKIRKALTRV